MCVRLCGLYCTLFAFNHLTTKYTFIHLLCVCIALCTNTTHYHIYIVATHTNLHTHIYVTINIYIYIHIKGMKNRVTLSYLIHH